MSDLSHLHAIELRLSHERARVDSARTEKEREWRKHNVMMIERERAAEIEFLARRGVVVEEAPPLDDIMSDDDLLSLLMA